MEPIFIVLIVIGAVLLCLFSAYLYLLMPSFKRRKQIMKFAEHKYAHRGLHGDGVAENSLSAFRRAVEGGYGIELDVRLSRDGELVVFHDTTLERVTGHEGRVDAYDYEELKKMKLCGTEDRIPLFSEVLEIVDGKIPLLVELKEEAGQYGVTEKALEILEGYRGEYIIESFNPLALGLIKKKKPEILRGMLSMNYMAEKKHRKLIFFLMQIFATNILCRPDFLSYDHKHYKNRAMRLCRALFRVTTFAWTVRSQSEEDLAYKHKFNSVIFENYIPGEKTNEV